MEEGSTCQEREGGQGDFYRQVRYVHSCIDRDRTDIIVGDDTGAFGAAAGLVFDAHDFLGGPRLQRGAIVIDNGKVVSVVVEKTPPEGEYLDPLVRCIADSSHRLLRRAGPHHRLDYPSLDRRRKGVKDRRSKNMHTMRLNHRDRSACCSQLLTGRIVQRARTWFRRSCCTA
jgi:hypothetical protein